ncbi:MAG TPA: hydroxymethylbilane synthase [Terriglobia bacterium]|nr:hydroxymethylbilane synthase [Terriglobia bacterium]
MKIVIGSRGSQLALWQANWVKDQLAVDGHTIAIETIRTSGDKLQSYPPTHPLPASFAQIGAEAGTKGLFIKEIEEALLAGKVDLAVHSLKDLPTILPEGLILAAVPPREDARDVFISADGKPFEHLIAGARVGTSSPRRQTQLRRLRPDLELIALRGNLTTRLRKLEGGDCAALVLAAAGLHRLGLRERITGYFSIDQICPAVGQGALAIEIRQGHAQLALAVTRLDDLPTHLAVRAERAMLRRLGGGCQIPIAGHANFEGAQLHLRGVVASLDGSRLIQAVAAGSQDDPEGLGAVVAEDLLAKGAREILMIGRSGDRAIG